MIKLLNDFSFFLMYWEAPVSFCAHCHSAVSAALALTDVGGAEGLRRESEGQECTRRNKVILSACTRRNPHMVGLKCSVCRRVGGDECSSTETFYFLWNSRSQSYRSSERLTCLFSINSPVFYLFFFSPLCCNVGSHGSNFDVWRCFLPEHIFVSSFHSPSQCPSNNKVVVTKLCLLFRFLDFCFLKEVSTSVDSFFWEADVFLTCIYKAGRDCA